MRIRTSHSILFLCLLILFSAGACSDAQMSAPPTATPRPTPVDMKAVLRDFLAGLPGDWNLIATDEVVKTKPFIVDVRQPEEYSQGFIQGAVNIPIRELAQNLQALPVQDQEIAVVCSTGHRAAVGMAVLQMLGYRKAKSMAGGMQAWQSAHLPVVTAPVPPRATGRAPQVNPQLLAALDYYLMHTLPFDWGVIDQPGLAADQLRKSSAEEDVQPEAFDQGPSLLVDVDEPEEFAQAQLDPVLTINVPLRKLPDNLDNMPLADVVQWA